MDLTANPAAHSRSLETIALTYDQEILPLWSERFGRLLLRDLDLSDKRQVLDVSCGTGFPAVEILPRLPEKGRLIAIDECSAMLDVARRKFAKLGAENVFLRTEAPRSRLPFADDVYDLVVCNLALGAATDPRQTLADYARVTRPGGEVRCTLPAANTFRQFYEVFSEVLLDNPSAQERLNRHLALFPSAEQCHSWLDGPFGDHTVLLDEYTLSFRSAREFLSAPMFAHDYRPAWDHIAGAAGEQREVFGRLFATVAAHSRGGAFDVTVVAARLTGVVESSAEASTLGNTDEIEILSADIECVEAADAEAFDLDHRIDLELEAFLNKADSALLL